MCGIAGFVDFRSILNSENLISATDALFHRGPDSNGYKFFKESFGTLGLGHRRLSILDLSQAGSQPMKFENLTMVYNGEVYNFIEIRNKLRAKGYEFISESDSEVILKAFHFWREDAINKLVGMFSIAIYDELEKVVYIARDQMGIKPLFWSFNNETFCFGSELKVINNFSKKTGGLNINHSSLYDYFSLGFVKAPKTIYENVYKLEPGTYLKLDTASKELTEKSFWSPQLAEDLHCDFTEAKQSLKDLLEDSVKKCLVSDVEVGLFLSGGIDSSLVASIAKKFKPDIRAISIGFDSKGFDETDKASKIAKYLNIDHEVVKVKSSYIDILNEIPTYYDEPIADNSVVPTLLLSRVTRESGLKVALSGDGGDELFFGYEGLLNLHSLFHSKRFKIFKTLNGLIPNRIGYSKLIGLNRFYYLNKTLNLINSNDILTFYKNRTSYFPDFFLQRLLQKNSKEDSFTIIDDKLSSLYDYFREVILPDQLLTKVDRASMASSLEVRVPILDHRIVELSLNIPEDFKISNGKTKYILKEILADYLPNNLIEGPKKGFTFPYWNQVNDTAFKDIINDNLLYLESNCFELFDPSVLNEIRTNFNENNDKKWIWSLLIFALWHRKWVNNAV